MENDGTITLFLADDHTLVRQGIAALIARSDDIRVIGDGGEGLKVVEQVVRLKPHVVVLDLSMPGLNGLDVCKQLARKAKGTAILILTMHAEEEFIVRALENGASGYMLKEAAADQLAEAVRAVARGDLYLGTGVPRGVLSRLTSGAAADPYNSLTIREREVLQLIAEGKTNRDIATMLDLSVKTVDTHRAHLMRKLNIHDQTSLVKFAIRRGIVQVH
jgi:DNA-binding NarL/FixJ family response regulator